MSEFTVIVGWVRAFAGTAPGPASGISYTIEYLEPGGGKVALERQIPSQWRYPDDTVEIDPQAMIGKPVDGRISTTGAIIWWFPGGEPIAFDPCDETPGPAAGVTFSPSGDPMFPVPPPTGGGTPPPTGGPSQPPGGGSN